MVFLAVMDDLETARLILHPMSIHEAERVAAAEPDDEARWAPGYPTEGERAGAGGYLKACAQHGDPQPFGAYEIRRREDGHAIGGMGFHGAPDEDGSVVIGYSLTSSVRGQGYASEALRGLLSFARTRGLTRVKGDTHHPNVASQRVMLAVGMKLVSEDADLKYYEITW
jgi:RimJ/RimL family protein N-acetyltransferase